MLVNIVAIFGFNFWSQDVIQEFLQPAGSFKSNVYLKPLLYCISTDQKSNPKTDETLIRAHRRRKLLSPNYKSTSTQLSGDVHTTGELSFFHKTNKGCLSGLIGAYMDDRLSAGDE